MTNELALATKSLAWIVAPIGILITAWVFGARYIALLRALMEALRSFIEASQLEFKRRAISSELPSQVDEKSASARNQVVWLGRDRDRFFTEGKSCLKAAALEFAKSTIPLAALLGFGILITAPWDPDTSPVAYFSGTHPSEPVADNSMEFIADAGLRFQKKTSELTAALATTTAERDALTAQLAAVKAEIVRADIPQAPRRTLLAAFDRRPSSVRPPQPGTADTGVPVTSLTTPAPVSPSATPLPSTPRPDRARDIINELANQWAAAVTELDALSRKGPDGMKFTDWVQPRLLTLIRSDNGTGAEVVLRELIAAFDTQKKLVSRYPTLTRVDQLLRQLQTVRTTR